MFVTGPASSRRNLANVERVALGPPPKPIQQRKPRDVAERTKVVGIMNGCWGRNEGSVFARNTGQNSAEGVVVELLRYVS